MSTRNSLLEREKGCALVRIDYDDRRAVFVVQTESGRPLEFPIGRWLPHSNDPTLALSDVSLGRARLVYLSGTDSQGEVCVVLLTRLTQQPETKSLPRTHVSESIDHDLATAMLLAARDTSSPVGAMRDLVWFDEPSALSVR